MFYVPNLTRDDLGRVGRQRGQVNRVLVLFCQSIGVNLHHFSLNQILL